jgi:hypothetical protein
MMGNDERELIRHPGENVQRFYSSELCAPAHSSLLRRDWQTGPVFMRDRTSRLSPSMSVRPDSPSVVVIIPCFNEAAAIGKAPTEFRSALPNPRVNVYDNNSTDGSAGLPGAPGAVVRAESLQCLRQA